VSETFKQYYRDEDDLIDDYCKSVGCSLCHGVDINGEPNGYGCPDLDEFLDENHEKYILEDEELIDFLEKELQAEKARVEKAEESLEHILKNAGNLAAAKHYAKFYFIEKLKELETQEVENES
jgi:hypothetical protein